MEIGGPEPQPAANTTASNPMEISANANARFGRDESEPGAKRNGLRQNGADMGPPLGHRIGVDDVMRLDSPLPENVLRPPLPGRHRRALIYRVTWRGNPVNTVVRNPPNGLD